MTISSKQKIVFITFTQETGRFISHLKMTRDSTCYATNRTVRITEKTAMHMRKVGWAIGTGIFTVQQFSVILPLFSE